MNSTAAQPNVPNALKLGLSTAATGSAVPLHPPPAPTFSIIQAPAEATADQTRKKDGFLAAAALGGVVAALAMLLLVPTCLFLTGVVRQSLTNSTDSAAMAQPTEPVRVVDWPEVVLSGILAADAEREGSAILNGQLVNLNQHILKVRVVAFHNQQVVLEYEGAQKALRVGENTL